MYTISCSKTATAMSSSRHATKIQIGSDLHMCLTLNSLYTIYSSATRESTFPFAMGLWPCVVRWGYCWRIVAPVNNQPRCAFSVSASNSTASATVLYEPIKGVEWFERYRPGGYHPVSIDDQFHGRYRVVHKLGHGSYSTTWLARDEHLQKYVAVKVCTADSKPQEFDILSTLTGAQHALTKCPGATMIPSILDRFSI